MSSRFRRTSGTNSSRPYYYRGQEDNNEIDKGHKEDGVPSVSKARTLNFERALITIKVGLIVTFLLVTAIYDTMYRDYRNSQTQLQSPDTRWKVGVEVALNFVSGALCTAFISKMRGGNLVDGNMVKNASVVGLILGLFALSLESSGFNRFLAREDTQKGVGVYAEINMSSYGGTKDLDIATNAGDPFLMSFSVLAIILVVLVVIYNMFKMFALTYDAYKSMEHPIKSGMWFTAELLGVVVMSVVPPIMASKLKGETPTSSTFVVAAGTGVAAVILQFMLQFHGIVDDHPSVPGGGVAKP